MPKHTLIAIVATACVAGCTSTYKVHVNTYAEIDRVAGPMASIYVVRDPNSPNPILRRQIEAKITRLLQGYGYHPVETTDAADYILTYRTGFDSEKVMEYAPVGGPYGGLYESYFGGWGFGYTTYLPYIETVYVHWLRMRLYRVDEAAASEESVVWIGEALMGTNDPEVREAVNYLLVGCLEYLGRDTSEWITTRIGRDDSRIIDIMGGRGQEAPAER